LNNQNNYVERSNQLREHIKIFCSVAHYF